MIHVAERSSGESRLNLRLVVILLFALWTSAAAAQEWTRFRGPNGSGVSEAKTIPIRWTEKDYRWRVPLPGVGHSSPVVWGSRVFLTTADEDTGRRTALCLRAEDGSLVWTRDYDTSTHRRHQLNSLASSTPAVDEQRVYLLWATDAEIFAGALDHEGNPLWRQKLGEYRASHGAGVSPIIHEDLVIVAMESQAPGGLIALDAETGHIQWTVPRDTKVSYSTPCIYRGAGEPAIIATNWEHGITAFEPRTGRIRWTIDVFDKDHVETSIGSPVIAGDLVLGTCGWLGYGTQTIAVRPSRDEATAREVWRAERGAPLTTTPLVVGNLVFLWADNGIVTCVDATSGRMHPRQRVGGTFYGSPVAAADAVYCLSVDGEAVVLKADPTAEVIARNPLGEGSHATPAIANGVMYLRTFSHLMAVGDAP
ncbi:MAG: PQQ-binding-like beta-propeller repeat protein [Planctomycetes bacterium]|nr:PQQ-binding-like beta-propeller repeat protein [Planctomycetota bacterium]